MPASGEGSVILVAIVGGSGAGKSWLASRLEAALPGTAARVCLDDFYRDRSQVPASRRGRINFDDPRALDWREVERVVADLAAGRGSRAPVYDFGTHTRRPGWKWIEAKPVVILEGLWLLRRRALRKFFSVRVFVDCPAEVRLDRRLARDTASRSRDRASIEAQFRATVDPMHWKYVHGQQRWADVVLAAGADDRSVERLLERIRALRGA